MYIDIVFTNEGDTVCELRGAPGVSVVDDDGTQIGAASRTLYPDVIPTATLQPGASMAATLQSVNVAGSGGPLDTACDATVGAGYRIYPPHSFRSVFVEVPEVAACASGVEWMSVGVVALN